MENIKLISQASLDLLKSSDRYKPMDINFMGKELKIVDSASFLSSYREIFEKGIYRFNPKNDEPVIVDCGANIGLSILFFKHSYPRAKIIAFEPVPNIFKTLKYNIDQFDCRDIELHNKALWENETNIRFMDEGADAGRIAVKGDDDNITEVSTVRLKDFINGPVDLLKIDIEGAELEVIKDTLEELDLVENIFVEYHSFKGKRQQVDILFKLLLDKGFRLHVHSANVSPNPFLAIESNLNMDMQLNVFGVRI